LRQPSELENFKNNYNIKDYHHCLKKRTESLLSGWNCEILVKNKNISNNITYKKLLEKLVSKAWIFQKNQYLYHQ